MVCVSIDAAAHSSLPCLVPKPPPQQQSRNNLFWVLPISSPRTTTISPPLTHTISGYPLLHISSLPLGWPIVMVQYKNSTLFPPLEARNNYSRLPLLTRCGNSCTTGLLLHPPHPPLNDNCALCTLFQHSRKHPLSITCLAWWHGCTHGLALVPSIVKVCDGR